MLFLKIYEVGSIFKSFFWEKTLDFSVVYLFEKYPRRIQRSYLTYS